MKRRLVAIAGVFCIAILVASGAYAGKPDKPDKPPRPGNITTECIVFTGNLEGEQLVEGCCPNAGPFPAYTMTLPDYLGRYFPGIYDGQLFINYYGAGRHRKYIVQFGNDDIDIEIIGGVIENDKKNKTLTVTFTNETAWDYKNNLEIPNLNFVLVRTSDLTDCPVAE